MEILMNNLPGDEELDEVSTESSNDAVDEDGVPVLDEEDLEENNLSDDDVDKIIWEEPKDQKGSSGPEEKDITD